MKDVFCKGFDESNFNIKEVLRSPLFILETKKKMGEMVIKLLGGKE